MTSKSLIGYSRGVGYFATTNYRCGGSPTIVQTVGGDDDTQNK